MRVNPGLVPLNKAVEIIEALQQENVSLMKDNQSLKDRHNKYKAEEVDKLVSNIQKTAAMRLTEKEIAQDNVKALTSKVNDIYIQMELKDGEIKKLNQKIIRMKREKESARSGLTESEEQKTGGTGHDGKEESKG